MSLINIKNLTFAYPGSYENIFENVSLNLDTNWKLGLTGRNGRGKTTLLRLLLGELPYSGSIEAQAEFKYFPFTPKDEEETLAEMTPGAAPEAQLWQIKKELFLLNLPEDILYRPFSTLSKGEQTKSLLALVFSEPQGFLLIDEPTNHLDMAGRDLVAQYLNKKTGFILVSHDRHFLDSCIDHILAINKADIVLEKGNFSTWLVNKTRQDQFEQQENAKLSQEIDHLNKTARASAQWSNKVEAGKRGQKVSGIKPDKGHVGAQAAKLMKRAKAAELRREKKVQEKSKLLKNLESRERLEVKSLTYHKRPLVTAEDFGVYYQDKAACKNISFQLYRGQRLALTGPNGAGKSSILKAIMGEPGDYRGRLHLATDAIISYVPQDTSCLQGKLREYCREQGLDETVFKTLLRKLDLTRSQFEKDMREFSAGQRKKVLIAAGLCRPCHLYIWDEPLNYIDVISRIQIEELIKDNDLTMIFVDHDKTFLENIATDVLDLS